MYDSQVLINHKKNLDYIVTLPFKEVPQCTSFLRILSGRKKKGYDSACEFWRGPQEPLDGLYSWILYCVGSSTSIVQYLTRCQLRSPV